jgi:alpha-acetolactate decarboxylase
MSEGFKVVQAANTQVNSKDLQFIEESLVKARVIESFDKVIAGHLRVFVQEVHADGFSVHIGSANPNQGGSGANYSVKKDGTVKLESTETIAPMP